MEEQEDEGDRGVRRSVCLLSPFLHLIYTGMVAMIPVIFLHQIKHVLSV